MLKSQYQTQTEVSEVNKDLNNVLETASAVSVIGLTPHFSAAGYESHRGFSPNLTWKTVQNRDKI